MKKIKILIIGLCMIMISGCECIELYYPDEGEGELPLIQQAQIAGGVGNSIAVKDKCDFIFTNQAGTAIYFCRYIKQDWNDEWIVSSGALKDIFTRAEVIALPDTIFSTIDSDAKVNGFISVIESIDDLSDGQAVYVGGDQIILTKDGTTNWNATSSGASTIKIAEFDDWAVVGDTMRWTY